MSTATPSEADSAPANSGVVVAVRGSVVDVRFDARLPPIQSLLRMGTNQRIDVEVLAELDARHVRAIALAPTQGLARGAQAHDTGGPLMAPVGKEVLSRMFDVFGNTIDCAAAPSDVRHQGHRCARAAGAPRQGGAFR